MTMEDIFGDVIYAYTRAQALEDGELVDVTPTAQEAGIKFPVAMTRAAFADAVEWNSENSWPQDESGRLWDVVWMLWCAIRGAKAGEPTDRLQYKMVRVPNRPNARGAEEITLVSVCGPGDDAEPVITIMLPGED